VGLYEDTVNIPFLTGTQGAFYDIQRTEVLKGPQGTLYGQNSSAGAVKYVSMDPGREHEAWASAGMGNHGAWEMRGYATGGIGDGPLSAV